MVQQGKVSKSASTSDVRPSRASVTDPVELLQWRRRLNHAKARVEGRRHELWEGLSCERHLYLADTDEVDFRCPPPPEHLLRNADGCRPGGHLTSPRSAAAHEPRYVGAQANELSKWINCERMLRHKEETDTSHPTLRMVLKIDDAIDIQQMMGSQLNAISCDDDSISEVREGESSTWGSETGSSGSQAMTPKPAATTWQSFADLDQKFSKHVCKMNQQIRRDKLRLGLRSAGAAVAGPAGWPQPTGHA